jgi:hypothetical protein
MPMTGEREEEDAAELRLLRGTQPTNLLARCLTWLTQCLALFSCRCAASKWRMAACSPSSVPLPTSQSPRYLWIHEADGEADSEADGLCVHALLSL